MNDEDDNVVPATKVHGDSGVTAVVAEVGAPDDDDVELFKNAQIPAGKPTASEEGKR